MPNRPYSYRIVDVFTKKAFEGNPLAVFPDGSGLDTATMQKVAREFNLSETVFVFPPGRADCAVSLRIFTPGRELIFAGHPTVGTSFVLLDEGIVQRGSTQFVLEEKVGPVPIRVEAGDRPLIWLRTPPITEGPTFDRGMCASLLGLQSDDLRDIPPQLLSAGNPTILIALKDQATVDRAWFGPEGIARIRETYGDPFCMFVFAPTPEGAYSRMFAPDHGIAEDAATGSSTGPLAAYMIRHGLTPPSGSSRFISEQGTKMGRKSLLHLQIHGSRGVDGIDVGGYVTPIAHGTMDIDVPES